jgi:hypothetical protein
LSLLSYGNKLKDGNTLTMANSVDSSASPKRYRRIKGLLTGESRRERKAKQAAERAAAVAAGKAAPADDEDADSTVYGVNVENASVQTPSSHSTKKKGLLTPNRSNEHDDDDELTFDDGNALQVILLLMNPNTRRFELLQLEFDSNKAVVKDVLIQIPHSVSDEALRKQSYTGVCDRTGQELYYSTRLAEVCHASDILIAIPENVEARECARLAKPILQDENVIEMVRFSVVCYNSPFAFAHLSFESISYPISLLSF